MTDITTLEVRKDDWSVTRIQHSACGELADREVLLAVDRQALTANNISYAATGDMLGYWGFFPAEEGWGKIPAMGWADVVASRHPEVLAGERVWGFFPMSSHLKIIAGDVSADHFSDVSAHRAQYAPVYARFDRAAANPIHDPAFEDHDSLLRGLYMTSWLVEDFLHQGGQGEKYYGANACIITSASSKTSIALAHRIKQRGELRTVGLTSKRNSAFCLGLGFYDEVVLYEDIAGLDNAAPVVLVDMAGSAKVLSDAHHHFANNMKYSCRVGATHYEEAGAVDGLPGAAPEFFFAPGHIQTRSAAIGAAALMSSLGADYLAFRADSTRWLEIVRSTGTAAVERVYQSVLAGEVGAQTGQVISIPV